LEDSRPAQAGNHDDPRLRRGQHLSAESTLRGRIGALSLHAQGKTTTTAARAKFLARFEAEVDLEGVLTEAERSKRAEHARKLYFTKLALKSAKTRRKNKAAH